MDIRVRVPHELANLQNIINPSDDIFEDFIVETPEHSTKPICFRVISRADSNWNRMPSEWVPDDTPLYQLVTAEAERLHQDSASRRKAERSQQKEIATFLKNARSAVAGITAAVQFSDDDDDSAPPSFQYQNEWYWIEQCESAEYKGFRLAAAVARDEMRRFKIAVNFAADIVKV